MKRLLLSLVLLLSIGGSANAYLCSPTTPPPWPNFGGWCQWQPNQYDHNHPFVHDCTSAGPDWGEVYLYSGTNFTGLCAAAWTYGGTEVLDAGYTFIELNGWWSGSTVNGVTTPINQVRSVKVGGTGGWGAYTYVTFSSGPVAGRQDDNYYNCSVYNPNEASLWYPDILPSCTHGFSIMSFRLSAQ
jgi:hypothetical protein